MKITEEKIIYILKKKIIRDLEVDYYNMFYTDPPKNEFQGIANIFKQLN